MYIKSLLPPNFKKHQTTQMGTKKPTTFKIFIQTNVMRVLISLHYYKTLRVLFKYTGSSNYLVTVGFGY